MTFNVGNYHRKHSTHYGRAEKPKAANILANVSKIREMLRYHSPDIVCLQEHVTSAGLEVISEAEIKKKLTRGLGYKWFETTPPATDGTGCTILWKESKFSARK